MEAALRRRFGAALVEVLQVPEVQGASAGAAGAAAASGGDAAPSMACTAEGVEAHLASLRPAVGRYGGRVAVLRVANGAAELLYAGPASIGRGLQAALLERFKGLAEVRLISDPSSG